MMRFRLNLFGVLRRRGWVVLLTTVVVAAAAFFYAQHRPAAYVASSYVVVNSGANATGPGSANEASSLATTYAGLIPKDSSIVQAVSAELRQPQATVRSHISVFTSNSTALVQVRYTAPTESLAIAGSRAVALAIIGPHPASNAIPGGAILLASLPESASPASSARTIAVPIGIVLGLVLGGILLFTWERLDPRVDSAQELADMMGRPVLDEHLLTGDRALALRNRWFELAGEGRADRQSGDGETSPSMVALVGVSDASTILADYVRVRVKRGRSGSDPVATPLDIRSWSDPRSDEGGGLVTADPQVIVLVVRSGEKARAVTELIDTLAAFGLEPHWGAFVKSGDKAIRAELSRQSGIEEAPTEEAPTGPVPSVRSVPEGSATVGGSRTLPDGVPVEVAVRQMLEQLEQSIARLGDEAVDRHGGAARTGGPGLRVVRPIGDSPRPAGGPAPDGLVTERPQPGSAGLRRVVGGDSPIANGA